MIFWRVVGNEWPGFAKRLCQNYILILNLHILRDVWCNTGRWEPKWADFGEDRARRWSDGGILALNDVDDVDDVVRGGFRWWTRFPNQCTLSNPRSLS